jgi:streptogramin lyase
MAPSFPKASQPVGYNFIKEKPGCMFFIRSILSAAVSAVVVASPFTANAAWVTQTLVGDGNPGFTGNFGPAKDSQIDNPFGVLRGPDGALWFTEYGGQRVRRLLKDGSLATVVGDGKRGLLGNGGTALNASLNMPHEIRFDPFGDLYIADMGNHVIRKVEMKTGKIDTLAGTGLPKFGGDGGPAKLAYLKQPHSIQFGRDACMYVCDTGNNLIRRISMGSGIITTFAGTGAQGPTPDGAPIQGTPLSGPRALDVDREGNLWLVTREGNQVLKLDMLNERIQVIAGTGEKGYSGDGGPARQATFRGPKGISLDKDGNVWIADTENNAVRRINMATGTIETIAGTGERGDGPDGDASTCKLSRVHGVFADADGAVYIGDSENHKIRVLKNK